MSITHISGQQAALAGNIDRDIEHHLHYSVISDNTPIFTPDPNEDKVQSCMEFICSWITERHPLEVFTLSQELGETKVAYSTRISDLTD